jgi:hypothetical protein
VGDTIPRSVTILGGQFNASLNWGADLIDGRALWLQVRIKDSESTWHELGRQPIAAVPYAMSLFPGAKVVSNSGLYTLKLESKDRDALIAIGGDDGIEASTRGTDADDAAVVGHAVSTSGEARGGYFSSAAGGGVYGSSHKSHGVEGQGCDSPGCYGGHFVGGSGVYAESQSSVKGRVAGHFEGEVEITNDLTVDGDSELNGSVALTGPQVNVSAARMDVDTLTYFNNAVGITAFGALGVAGRLELNESGKMEVDGEIEFSDSGHVTGPVVFDSGSVTFDDGASFDGTVRLDAAVLGSMPRPAFDSDWIDIGQGRKRTLTHDLGGNTDRFVVDLQCRAAASGVNNRGVGGDSRSATDNLGAFWADLTSTSVSVTRQSDNTSCTSFRIRIWTYR